ncbi:MAG: hypothetical protein HC837_20340 [Chloroflexaceae bacterium]|nr:hypothetical protein [Chloroflexaceae bacterium]
MAAGSLLDRRIGWLPPAFASLALLLLLVLQGLQLPSLDSRDPSGRVWGEHFVALKNREMGLWLRLNTPPDTLIATGIAGALPYYAERPVLDALGLNDVHIAHLDVEHMGQGICRRRKDRPHVYSRPPTGVCAVCFIRAIS